MTVSTIDIQEYIKLATKVYELMNKCYKVNIYRLDDIEIIQSVQNMQDGKGPLLVSSAAVRNPIDGRYDMTLDLIGTPEQALDTLIQSLQKFLDLGGAIMPTEKLDTKSLN